MVNAPPFAPALVPVGLLPQALAAMAAAWSCWGTVSASPAEMPPQAASEVNLYVTYAAKPDTAAVLAHNLCILDPAAEAPLGQGKAMGHTHLAYISTVEVIPDSPAALRAKERGIPIAARNAGWNSEVLDITHPAWNAWLLEDLIRPAIEKGYDGIFLDTLDSTERLTAGDAAKARVCHAVLVRAIRDIHSEFPDKRMLLNRGFALLDDVHESIHGVLIESLYQSWLPEKKTFCATDAEGTQWLLNHIARIQAKKLPVFIVDYVPQGDTALAQKTASRIRAQGCIPFITTPELQGVQLTPLPKTPRVAADDSQRRTN